MTKVMGKHDIDQLCFECYFVRFIPEIQSVEEMAIVHIPHVVISWIHSIVGVTPMKCKIS